MNKKKSLGLTALLCLGVASTAVAQGYWGDTNTPYGQPTYGNDQRWGDQNRGDRWGRVGTVEFNTVRENDARFTSFGGSVEGIRLEARDADVRCRDVRATFMNGRSVSLFEGTIPRHQPVVLDLPGGDRAVRSLEFFCRGTSTRANRVDVAVDLGRYQAEWQRHPSWSSWSPAFPWADRDRGPQWVTLGSERFNDRRDRQTTIAGRRGEQISSLALQPMNADARCRNIEITFRNGGSRRLEFSRNNYLNEGEFYRIDLPGQQRNVERIDMTCQAVRGRGVTMQVFASR